MKRLFHGIMIVMLCSCTTTQVPEKVVNTTLVGVGIYCGVFHNVHRIVVRAIHVVDPEWQSICDNEVLNSSP